MNQLNEITDLMSLEELLEVKGGESDKIVCVFKSAISCNEGAIKDDDDEDEDNSEKDTFN